MKDLTIFLILFFCSIVLHAQPKKEKVKFEKLDISMFPKAKEGQKQVYFQVPVAADENNLKIEFFVGKEQLVDCNRHFMQGTTAEVNLDGWGYTYYTVESNGVVASTRMGCPDNTKKKQFVNIQPTLCRYNSKLPVVVYVPQSLEVRYRIWRADGKLITVK